MAMKRKVKEKAVVLAMSFVLFMGVYPRFRWIAATAVRLS